MNAELSAGVATAPERVVLDNIFTSNLSGGYAIIDRVRVHAGLPIYEYAPRRVKQAVVGRGGAEKEQVAFMVRALLGLTETPASDSADALAVGLTHFQTEDRARWKVGEMERI